MYLQATAIPLFLFFLPNGQNLFETFPVLRGCLLSCLQWRMTSGYRNLRQPTHRPRPRRPLRKTTLIHGPRQATAPTHTHQWCISVRTSPSSRARFQVHGLGATGYSMTRISGQILMVPPSRLVRSPSVTSTRILHPA